MTKLQKIKKQLPAIRKEVLPWAIMFLGNMIVFGWVFAYLEDMSFWKGFFTGPYFGVVTGTTTGFGDVLPHHHLSAIVTVYISISSWLFGLITAAKMVEVLVKNPHLYSHAEQEREEAKTDLILEMLSGLVGANTDFNKEDFPSWERYQEALKAVKEEEENQ